MPVWSWAEAFRKAGRPPGELQARGRGPRPHRPPGQCPVTISTMVTRMQTRFSHMPTVPRIFANARLCRASPDRFPRGRFPVSSSAFSIAMMPRHKPITGAEKKDRSNAIDHGPNGVAGRFALFPPQTVARIVFLLTGPARPALTVVIVFSGLPSGRGRPAPAGGLRFVVVYLFEIIHHRRKTMLTARAARRLPSDGSFTRNDLPHSGHATVSGMGSKLSVRAGQTGWCRCRL